VEALYIRYFATDQRLPVVGEACDFRYRVENVAGLVGLRNENVTKGKVVDDFDCRSAFRDAANPGAE
jgi:hypothetical protein